MTPVLLIATAGDGLFGGVRDFFDSGVWLLIRNLTLFFVGVFYIATVFWVYKDARRRIEDPWMVVMATILGAIPPFLGPIIYLFFRPPEYLDDVRERELEIKAMEERLARRDLHCPVCRAEVDASFLVCPVCTTKLKQACANCKAPLEALWQVCPFCEAQVDSPGIELDAWEPEPEPRREKRRPPREVREVREPREAREPREVRETREMREAREMREVREPQEVREPREARRERRRAE